MRLVILGGGGFRVPLVHGRLLADPDHLVDELVLHDVDPARLAAIEAVLDAQAAGRSWRPKLSTRTSLDDALRGADVVFSAIRVGGLAGRSTDERNAIEAGLLGQETVGAGGIAYALRTVPVAVDVAERVARYCPDAWTINFTNPAGTVTEAMSEVLGDRVIGICDSPIGLCRRVAGALDIPAGQAWFDYAGLNHLGWLRGVRVNGRDRLPELLAEEKALRSFEEGRLFEPDWLRALGAIPNEYLHYYYYARETKAEIAASGQPRGEFLRRQQQAFYDRAQADPAQALQAWEETRAERERTYLAEARAIADAGDRDTCDTDGGGYEQVALDLMSAITANRPATMILNIRNRGALPGLDANAVVELPCLADGNGAHPIATTPLDPPALALVQQVKAVERETIRAARTGSREAALRALEAHPLVDSLSAARQVLAATQW
ncbi:6-phospho-beta-glucosidase [Crossiella equi]|uniref:6-phospho-beta-glucosidase n=1 Tax=Crossiella equi TaxID=130796 RepID=A0ABS5A9D2_9PSEU|nr:6-phospho-beta-glucosidase [Crossiella equi]MBP2472824.1 6-phospho-beta-glucosidase [Crossiella equi]